MRDGLEFEESSQELPNYLMHRLIASIALISMSYNDKEWFDENCPDWEQHLSFKAFAVETKISDQWKILPPDVLKTILNDLRKMLIYDLSEHIIEHIEPKITEL